MSNDDPAVTVVNQIASIQEEINQKLIAISESLAMQSSLANTLTTQVEEHLPYLKAWNSFAVGLGSLDLASKTDPPAKQ